MSDWRDTVMNKKELAKAMRDRFGTPIWGEKDISNADIAKVEIQAEISFKLGYNQALKDIKEGGG